MPIKALMEASSGLAWATQQDPEETQILRQTGGRWNRGVMTSQGRQECGTEGSLGATEPIFAPIPQESWGLKRAFRSPVNEVAGGL